MSQALYRRYRPDTFTEVIGQEHVTEPLMQALRADKVTHAYLFSGPRGCGKTTSARILARCLNCAQGPTPEPCGVCDSCVELGTGGPGSLDVVEIDAASHGGVDDARDLRERATFAPARDRFKIFILDEAHMVTSQGFNALLKIVEEPPAHVKFIFATTEPDKVIGTIRSRTHHYPFRLVGPATLQPYLEQICAAEDVPVGSGVLPLVVRAGGGSVRDSLSVLDQLVAGADAGGIDYERAVALLGYTHAALLDDVVDAIAARDGASAFRVVDRVVSSGHEPRRFVEDLLERLRDLIVIAASGAAAEAVLRDLPADQLDRMRSQSTALGSAELSRSADLVNTALTEMTGATSPRLHLELLVARLLLPAADDGARGLGARLDRVERQLTAPATPSPPATPPSPVIMQSADADADADAGAVEEVHDHHTGGGDTAAPAAPPVEKAASGGVEAETVRRRWSEVLETIKGIRRATWVLASTNAQVTEVSADTVTLAFSTPQLATTFRTGGHAENVQRALHETLGIDVRVETALASAATTQTAPDRQATGPTSGGGPVDTSSTRRAEASWSTPADGTRSRARDTAARTTGSDRSAEVASAADGVPDGPEPEPEPDPTEPGPGLPTADRPAPGRATPPPAVGPRTTTAPTRARGGAARPAPDRSAVDDGDDADPEDPDLASSGLVGAPLVAQMLGGTVIDEIPDPPA